VDALACARPALHGTPVPGSAWDDYRRAIWMMKGVADISSIARYATRSEDADRTKAVAVASSLWAAVEGIEVGARKAVTSRSGFQWTAQPNQIGDDDALKCAWKRSMLAIAKARLLEEERQFQKAAWLLLDVGQFAQDIGRDGSATAAGFALHIFGSSQKEPSELLDPPARSLLDLRQLDRDLEQLDAWFAGKEPAILGELEDFGNRILDGRLLSTLRLKQVPSEARPGWRHAFSWRLMTLAAFDEAASSARMLRDLDRLSDKEERQRWNE